MIIPDWIIWTAIFAGVMTLIAAALVVIAVAVVFIRARRNASPAKQLHRLGTILMDSSGREHQRMGFDLIGFAHTLDPAACSCPQMTREMHGG